MLLESRVRSMYKDKGKKVLVVDDSEDNLLLMELLLQHEGYRVSSANSGTKGLEAVDKQLPDLIILDLMMPDMSGLEIIKHLKDRCYSANIPILLLTANCEFKHADRNIDALCYKPFSFDSILEQISSLLFFPAAV